MKKTLPVLAFLLSLLTAATSCTKEGAITLLPPADSGSVTMNSGDAILITESSDADITWKSSDSKIADVIGGYLFAYSPGTSVITGQKGKKKVTFSVAVTARNVTSAKFPNPVSLKYGTKSKVSISNIEPEEATAMDISWSVEPENIVDIKATKEGLEIQGTAEGEGVVTGTSATGETLGSFRVRVTGLTSFTISDNILQLGGGEKKQLSATQMPEDLYEVKWSSSDPSIASVDSEGNVTAGNKTGAAVITAEAGIHKASCNVTVIASDYEAAIFFDAQYSYSGYYENPFEDNQFVELEDKQVYLCPANYAFFGSYTYGWRSFLGGVKGGGPFGNDDDTYVKEWNCTGSNWTFFGHNQASKEANDFGFKYSNTLTVTLANGTSSWIALMDGYKEVRLDYLISTSSSHDTIGGTIAGGEKGETIAFDIDSVDPSKKICLTLRGEPMFGWMRARSLMSSNTSVIRINNSYEMEIVGTGATTIGIGGTAFNVEVKVTRFKAH